MTTTWKWVAAVFLAALIALACGLSYVAGLSQNPPETTSEVVELPDGEQVMCVLPERGGASCDWMGLLQ